VGRRSCDPLFGIKRHANATFVQAMHAECLAAGANAKRGHAQRTPGLAGPNNRGGIDMAALLWDAGNAF